jgi:hypothetical protein
MYSVLVPSSFSSSSSSLSRHKFFRISSRINIRIVVCSCPSLLSQNVASRTRPSLRWWWWVEQEDQRWSSQQRPALRVRHPFVFFRRKRRHIVLRDVVHQREDEDDEEDSYYSCAQQHIDHGADNWPRAPRADGTASVLVAQERARPRGTPKRDESFSFRRRRRKRL